VVFETILNMGKENKTRDAVDAVTGLVKAVPVYQDLVQPTAKEIGVGLQNTVYLALAPISGLVWGFDKIKIFVGTSVAKRLEKIQPKQIITPMPQVAGPALEALKYTGHDETLREMFAKLLATAMDEKTAANAHPSFVEIIRQLSTDEAKICRLLKEDGYFPVINLNEECKKGYKTHWANFSPLGYDAKCQFPTFIQSYLDNLCRLKVIEIHYEKWLTDNKKYNMLKRHPDLRAMLKEMKTLKQKPSIERGLLTTTAFGQTFLDACVD